MEGNYSFILDGWREGGKEGGGEERRDGGRKGGRAREQQLLDHRPHPITGRGLKGGDVIGSHIYLDS